VQWTIGTRIPWSIQSWGHCSTKNQWWPSNNLAIWIDLIRSRVIMATSKDLLNERGYGGPIIHPPWPNERIWFNIHLDQWTLLDYDATHVLGLRIRAASTGIANTGLINETQVISNLARAQITLGDKWERRWSVVSFRFDQTHLEIFILKNRSDHINKNTNTGILNCRLNQPCVSSASKEMAFGLDHTCHDRCIPTGLSRRI